MGRHFSSKDLPLVSFNDGGNKVPPLKNPAVENASNLVSYEYLKP